MLVLSKTSCFLIIDSIIIQVRSLLLLIKFTFNLKTIDYQEEKIIINNVIVYACLCAPFSHEDVKLNKLGFVVTAHICDIKKLRN